MIDTTAGLSSDSDIIVLQSDCRQYHTTGGSVYEVDFNMPFTIEQVRNGSTILIDSFCWDIKMFRRPKPAAFNIDIHRGCKVVFLTKRRKTIEVVDKILPDKTAIISGYRYRIDKVAVVETANGMKVEW